MGLREIQPRFSKPIPPEPPASNPYRETRPSHPQDQGRSRISGGSATCAAGDVPQHRRRRQFRFDHHRLRGSLPGRGFHRGRHWMFPGVPTNALEPHRRSADRTLGWVDHRPLDRVAHLNTNIIPVAPKSGHAPYWVLTVVGLVFALAGLLVWGMAWRQLAYEKRQGGPPPGSTASNKAASRSLRKWKGLPLREGPSCSWRNPVRFMAPARM
jgi:hypothetical protein